MSDDRKKDIKAESLSEAFTATCPNDGSIIESNDLILHFTFPDDADAVLDLLTQRINIRACPVCKHPVQIIAPMVAFNSIIKATIVVADGIPQDKLSGQLARVGIVGTAGMVEDYVALRLAVLPWILDYMRETLLVVVTGQIGLINPEKRRNYLPPLRLGLLRLFADDVLTVALSLPDTMLSKIKKATGKDDAAAAIRALLPRQVAATVHGYMTDLFHDAAEGAGLNGLYTAVEAALPPDAISDTVLEMFLGDCKPVRELQGGADFMDAYRAQVVNAIVHARAGRANPQSKAWADYLQLAWRLCHERENSRAFPWSLLPSSTTPKFTCFEDLWDVSARDLMDGKNRIDMETRAKRLETMMRSLGFEKRFADALVAGPFRFQIRTEDPEKEKEILQTLITNLHDTLLHDYAFSTSIATSLAMGSAASVLFRHLQMNGYTDAVSELATWLIADATKAGDFVAAFEIGCRAIQQLNVGEAWVQSVAIAAPLVTKFTDTEVHNQLEKAGAPLTVDFWNEVGNTFRYLHEYDQALSAYKISRQFLQLIEDKGKRDADQHVLDLNEARVYRHIGRYAIALRRIAKAIADQPDDAEAHHALAMLYYDINRFDEALRSIDQAIAVSLARSPHGHASMLITRAVIQARRGLLSDAAANFEHADNLIPTGADEFKVRLAAAVAFWVPNLKKGDALAETAEKRLWSFINGEKSAFRSPLLTALGGLGILLLNQGRLDDVQQLDSDYIQSYLADCEEAQCPLELLQLKGRVERKLRSDESSWPWFDAALSVLEADVPQKEDAAFSGTWLADKEAFQTELIDVAVALLYRQAIDPTELLRIYEFVNGRSLGARLARENAALDLKATIVDRLRAAAELRGREIVVFLFVDASDAVHVLRLSSTDPLPRLVEGGVFPRDRVCAVGERFVSAIKRANPAALDILDRDLKGWATFAEELGRILACHIPVGAEVCFLPGRHLTALPLHLVMLPTGESLIEKHPVTYAANFALLLDDHSTGRKTSETLVITVAKANDTATFRARLDDEGKKLIKHLEATGRTAHRLDGREATTKSVVSNLSQSDEAFFLCHGTHGGRIKGYGICLSDGKNLPPALLPVDDAPDFARFVLGWDDLEGLTSAPRLVVSVACSTARVAVAPGGVRLGLEQTLFTGGTRAILSPLWDVDQDASLYWLDAFRLARQNEPNGFFADAHRAACRTMKKLYKHPYFWAPFIMSGSLFERTL
jgi:tetratricopeptide (TPR) repeat protein